MDGVSVVREPSMVTYYCRASVRRVARICGYRGAVTLGHQAKAWVASSCVFVICWQYGSLICRPSSAFTQVGRETWPFPYSGNDHYRSHRLEVDTHVPFGLKPPYRP